MRPSRKGRDSRTGSLDIELTLPEGEENYGLDGKELDDGVEGPEEVLGRHVEHQQRIQRNRNAEIIVFKKKSSQIITKFEDGRNAKK